MKKPAIIIASDDTAIRRHVSTMLAMRGCDVVAALNAGEILPAARRHRAALIIIGPCGSGTWDSLHVAQQIRRVDSTIALILIAAHSSEALVIAALRAGITDYFKPPLVLDELSASVMRCLSDIPAPQPSPTDAPEAVVCPMVGASPAMQQIKAYISQVAMTDSTVLISGESGTGKELVAEMIHRSSARHARPFVGINCAAIPDSLLESELFGHEKGAFTGATGLKEGQFQLADGGTVFLDEIGDMSPYAQAKILRAIETKTIYRLGGKRSIPVDVRIIAATNQDIEDCVAAGKFRPDLYFRLNVGRIHLPPVRERHADLPALLDHYRGLMNQKFGLRIERFSPEVLARLLRHHWPGNVREVKNLVEAVFINLINAPARQVSLQDLPAPFRQQVSAGDRSADNERTRVLSALLQTNWNMSQAAQQLCWSRMTLYRKLRKYQIVKSPTPTPTTALSAFPALPRPLAAAVVASEQDDVSGAIGHLISQEA
jgi:DNA-binding NtrC family response regulator